MKKIFYALSLSALLFQSCHKDEKGQLAAVCDIQKIYADNASKVTITNGIWGTVGLMEGNCMPVIPPTSSTCKSCPVKRTVRIYDYTLASQAVPQNGLSYYDSFITQLV